MAKLEGYSVKISGLDADHTYVLSDDGYVWPCFGRSSGGHKICYGSGSSAQAECISKPDSTADLVYAITGVCHQASNRILWPTSNHSIVSEAKGYWASAFLYGTYGTKLSKWEDKKKKCCGNNGDDKETSGDVSASDEGGMEPTKNTGDTELIEKIHTLHSQLLEKENLKKSGEARVDDTSGLDILVPVEEMKLVANYKLGKNYNKKKIESLQRVQEEILKEKKDLDVSLIKKTLAPIDYAGKVNRLLNDMLNEFHRLLGAEDYKKFLNLEPGEELQLIDPEILSQSR